MIPEPHDAIAQPFEIGGALGIGLFRMLSAVQFDDQPLFGTKKIGDWSSHRCLPPELEPTELTVAQILPELALDVGGASAQALRVRTGPADRQRKAPLIQATVMS